MKRDVKRKGAALKTAPDPVTSVEMVEALPAGSW
jgi:hypothetical protein